MNPLPLNKLLQLTIVREKSGFFNSHPKYHIYLSEDPTYHLLSVKKMKGNKTSNYLFSNQKKIFNKLSDSTFGKLRSNFKGTEF